MPHGYVLYTFAVRVVMIRMVWGDCVHIGVRLRVARFDQLGNAKAFNREASNKCWLHAFFLWLCVSAMSEDELIKPMYNLKK